MTTSLLPTDLPTIHGEILFATRHGSRLYGFQTESSDEDWFIVTDSNRRRTTHTVEDVLDVTQMGWDDFLAEALRGSHQSLEAAFSTEKIWLQGGDERAYLDGLRVTGTDVFNAYRRTIRKFSFGDFKQRRHAVRLAGNLLDLQHRGRFDPSLSYREAAFAGNLAENLAGSVLDGILSSQFR